MKNLYTICLLALLTVSSTYKATAQQLQSVYEGTWHYEDGNELFIVSLWQENDGTFSGYYKKVEYNNGTQGTVILNSRIVNNQGAVFPPVIFGRIDPENYMSGILIDNTLVEDVNDFKKGILRIELIDSCTNCPYTATWKVSERSGLRVGFVPGFSVPTDVILTKVSNTVDLD